MEYTFAYISISFVLDNLNTFVCPSIATTTSNANSDYNVIPDQKEMFLRICLV